MPEQRILSRTLNRYGMTAIREEMLMAWDVYRIEGPTNDEGKWRENVEP
jgi:hypothetical protein